MKLLPILRRLGSTTAPQDNSASSSSRPSDSRALPDSKILSVILAHIFDNNYSLLSVFDATTPESSGLDEKLRDLKLRWGGGLPLLWAYMWGLDAPSDSKKGKEKAGSASQSFLEIATGQLEKGDEAHTKQLQITFQTILIAAQRSASNLFILAQKLDLLSEFLLYRLYGPAKNRKYAEAFPARPDWIDRYGEDLGDEITYAYRPPTPTLREVYLSLFKKMLEAGVTQKITRRLFEVVKTTEADRRKADEEVLNSGTQTPTDISSTPTKGFRRTPGPSEADETISTLTSKLKRRPQLTLVPTTPPPVADMERLNAEVLDLLRHGMRSRWPDIFVLRGGNGISEAGIELSDLGRAWPAGQKGFHYSVSLADPTGR
jgi:hypothetical protein